MGLFRRKPRFDDEVQRIIGEVAAPGTKVTRIDQDTLQLDGLVIGLANLRAKWERLEETERRPWLSEALPALVSPPAIPARLETTQPLRPGIRPRSMLESARLNNLDRELNPGLDLSPEQQSGAAGNRPLVPFQPFGGDLVTVLLWDAPATMSVVNQSQLEEWGARFQDLLPVAIDNLEDAPNGGWRSVEKRVWISLNQDDYDGARMLVPGYLDQTGLAGELVVIHPNRNLLIATAVDDADGIRIACDLALDELDAPSPISFQPLVGQGDDWRPLALPPSHPAYKQWRRLICLSQEMNYKSLQEPLQRLVGHDLLVSGFQIAEAPGGNFVSVTTWNEGVPSLLPRADMIGLVTERGEAITAEWESVQLLMGADMEPTDHFPELWRVMSFPSNGDLAKLRSRSSR